MGELLLGTSKFAFIGAGNMCRAVLMPLVVDNVVSKDRVMVSNRGAEKLESWNALGVATTQANQEAVDFAEVVFLCVKPQMAQLALHQLTFRREQLVVSLLAGCSMSYLASFLGGARQIRVMPNTPMLCGEGACGIVAGPSATSSDTALILGIFEHIAKQVVVVDEEAMMEGVTCVAGSGPAYVFHMMEAMIAAGQAEGLSEEQAKRLAIQTVVGAGVLASQSDVSIEQLRRNVTSPNGCTQAGLEYMADKEWFKTTTDALAACAERSRELGREQLKALNASQ